MRKFVIIAVVVGFVVIVLLLLAMFFAGYIMTGKRQTLEEAFAWQTGRYDTSFYAEIEKNDYEIESYDGYKIHVELLKNPEESDKYIIISHGYTDNRMGALKYAPMYLELGYNCVIYDLRGHGENEETFTTYGIREGKDIYELVKDTRDRYENIEQLGLHGESLGAASTITSLKYKPEVDFVVADCGFSDINNVLKKGIKNAHMPGVVLGLADIGARIRYHYSLKKMNPIEALEKNEIPILFIHGKEDDFIEPKNSEDMAETTKGYKEIYLIDGAGHAESVLVAPDVYKEHVKKYLENINMR